MQTVKFTYSGSSSRKLTVNGRDQVIVSGDNNSTQFVFTIPKSYKNYNMYIVFGDFYVETEKGEPTVPLYYINRQDDTFRLPSDITSPNAGREIYFQLVFYEDQGDNEDRTIIETSQAFPIYVSKQASKVKYYEYSDVLTQLSARAYVQSAYDIDAEQDRPIIKFITYQGNEHILVLDIPYLQNGKIPQQFIPDVLVEIHKVEYYDELEAISAKASDLALIIVGNNVKGDYKGDIFLYVDEDDGWIPIYSQFDSQKLDTIEEGAQVNVQSDWLENNIDSDKYILNKPTLGTAQQYNIGTTQGTIPTLGQDGKLPNSTIPPLAIGEIVEWPQGMEHTVQNLTNLSNAEQGDIAVVDEDTEEDNGVYFLNGAYDVASNWIQIIGPSNVISVNGMTGAVIIGISDLDSITQEEIQAIDSGITTQKVQTYDNYATQIQGKIAIIQNPTAGTLLVSTQTGEVQESSELTSKLNGIEQGAQQNVIEAVKVNNTQLPITNKTVNVDLSGYVEKDGDKVLSTNDFTDQLKDKLDGIESGAEQNIIEQVALNGVALPINNKVVVLTADSVPTPNSNNLIISGAVQVLKQQVDTNTEDISAINNSDVMNSGITQAKVQQYDLYDTTKQNVIVVIPNTVLIADNSGAIVSSSVTTDELSCLSGVASNIQQQLNDKTSYTKAIREWDSTATYGLNSTVVYNSKIYISIYDGDNINHPPTDDAYWEVIQGGGGGSSSAIVRIIGDGVNTEYVITHGFNTYDFFYSIRYNDTQNMAYVGAEVSALTLNTAKITFAEAPEANSIRVILSPGATGQTVSGDTGIRYVQQVASTTWTITNTLGRLALVQVMDTSGKFVEGVVTQTLNNDSTYTVTVNFNEPVAGTALLI